MYLTLSDIRLPPGSTEDKVRQAAARLLHLPDSHLHNFTLTRKSIDARKKTSIQEVYSARFRIYGEQPAEHWQNISNLAICPSPARHDFPKVESSQPIIIAGMGPAGLFCALRLAAYGISSTLLERGRPVEERVQDVSRFWHGGLLNPESNVQFGEGGAGTFSDGKLTCRLRDPNTAWVLEQLVNFGAPAEIMYHSKPHVGTDRLQQVVSAIRTRLVQQGCQICFNTRLVDLVIARQQLAGVLTSTGDELPCGQLVLAIGHSARDTYSMLVQNGLTMIPKPFAIGLRVEHPQGLIDRIQYGQPDPVLPAADYSLTWNNTTSGRSCYSFCMCPGGQVIASSSEAGMVVVNGMSNLRRNSGFANSALVVNVRPDDFMGNDPLAGVRFQQHWEQAAFVAGGSNYSAPAQNLLLFAGKGRGKGGFCSSYQPGCVEADLATVLPDYVAATIREGIQQFDKRMKGFMTSEATLTGVETRTSAPVRILRGDDLQSPALKGLYPCGEGAGYAGGIMSAALDGVRVADRIAQTA